MSLKKFLFENESVDGISSPSQYMYIKIVRFMLVIVGSWPRREIGEPEPRYQTIMLNLFFFCVVNAALFGSISYVYIHTSELSFLEVGHMYIVILMTANDMSRVFTLTLSQKYRDLAKEFLTKIHLFYFKDHSPYAMLTHKKVHLICHLFSLCLLAQMLTGCSLFNLMPMYTNYSSGRYASGGTQNSTFEHSLYFSYPFNTSTDFNGYVVACIFHWLLSYLCSTQYVMFDLFLSIMVLHIWGHFKILINSLNNFPKPSAETHCELEQGININAEKYSKEELVEVSQKLKECIDYHREIIQFTNAMSDVFGPMLFCYYVFHQASGCLLLLECSQMTAQALIRFLPLTIVLTQQLIQLSVIFELVGSESEKLKDAVYGIPWECMDASNRKVVAFFLMNVQEPVHIKALGIANVGVTSMATILKTSISYFTFLRSI
ncbi:odorant receptor 13a-like [Spodoptera litura]|uniref:Odorant receptor n=1 Tax=Spodoptera litura TaxID=69820 RepID=A0A9J7IQK0_SPOLT|nr:odorant receptor 13a-like [Spodoptera litura]